jgi:hypothetical protein
VDSSPHRSTVYKAEGVVGTVAISAELFSEGENCFGFGGQVSLVACSTPEVKEVSLVEAVLLGELCCAFCDKGEIKDE